LGIGDDDFQEVGEALGRLGRLRKRRRWGRLDEAL